MDGEGREERMEGSEEPLSEDQDTGWGLEAVLGLSKEAFPEGAAPGASHILASLQIPY